MFIPRKFEKFTNYNGYICDKRADAQGSHRNAEQVQEPIHPLYVGGKCGERNVCALFRLKEERASYQACAVR